MVKEHLEYEYLQFRTFKEGKNKTYTAHIYSRFDNSARLGEIKWCAPWRRYCFFPSALTLYDATCLGDVVNHIELLEDERKGLNEEENNSGRG